MKISLNELQSVCRKAFMGMGFTPGHADDACGDGGLDAELQA